MQKDSLQNFSSEYSLNTPTYALVANLDYGLVHMHY